MVLFLLLGNRICFSQVQADEVIEQILESISRDLSEEHDYSELNELLDFYRKNPLNINLASREQLQELQFISPLQINTILQHRLENGMFLDPLELQSLQGFDSQTIRWLLYFVNIDPRVQSDAPALKNLLAKGNHDLMIRFGQVLEGQSGFSPSAGATGPEYLGSALRVFTRYRYNYANSVSASLNMEKDAGEQFFSGKGNSGFDFYSGNISFRRPGLLRKLVIGDYALKFGQGLIMWSGSGFGKGAGLNTMAKQGPGLRPYSSVNEALFLRGASGTFNYKKFSLTPFLSDKKFDAALSESDQGISSMGLSGLHRTKTELGNKNRASQLVYGANIQYAGKDLSIGLTAYHTRFSLPFSPPSSLYQQYNFRGNALSNAGIYYNYTYKNSYIFGEAAHSMNSGFAFINGLMSSLSSQVSLVVLYRNYAKDYHSFFNQSVSEANDAVNEQGFYSGLAIKLNPRWELFTYSDLFRFPWLKFRVDAPSAGYELLAQLSYSPNKKLKLISRFKQQVRQENSDELNDDAGLEIINKQNYRMEISYRINDNFSLRNRAELVQFHKAPVKAEFGFLNYQDIIYDPLSSKFSGNIRFGIFDTASFNSRIYAYENDVLYAYSVPVHQGSGLRCYINGRYKIFRGLDIWLRYALINYAGQQTAGSSADLISENQRSDFKFQLRYQF